jgi:hypothetical protein
LVRNAFDVMMSTKNGKNGKKAAKSSNF